jgi:hypothetical protein
MDEETPASARALLPCLLPLDSLKHIRDQNLLVLEPVDTLEELCREELTEGEVIPLKEYRLHGKPQSLEAFLDLFLLENGEYDGNLAICIPDSDAFICISQGQLEERVPEAFREGVFQVELWSDNLHRCHRLAVLSSTVEQAMLCLEFLFGLHDSHFQYLDLYYKVPRVYAGEPPRLCVLCPLTSRCLEKLLLQNENRENAFYYMAFTPEQSRVLAASGNIIGLFGCIIPDGGAAFVDAAQQHSSLTQLSLHESVPFDDINFVGCLNHLNLEHLRLSSIKLDDGQTCRAVAAAEIKYLHLFFCEFGDEEAVQVLVNNIREERGPKGLFLEGKPFNSPERLGYLMNALRDNTYLERVDFGSLDVRTGTFQALVAALPENGGLTHLGLTLCIVDDCCWDKLMSAIAEHPSLRTLSFSQIDDENESWFFLERHEPIYALAGMLAKNEHVDSIEVENFGFGRDVWDEVVVPRLEINVYRKRFLAIQKIQNRTTRAAVTARALALLENKPSLRWMLLSQNDDIVASYLAEALTCNDEGSCVY